MNIFFLVLDLRGNAFRFPPFYMILAVGVVICSLYYFEVCSFYPKLVEYFSYEWTLNLKCFFCICWDNHVALGLHYVDVIYYINGFASVQSSFHPWNKPHFIMVYDLLMCYGSSFTNILLRIFASMFIKNTGL